MKIYDFMLVKVRPKKSKLARKFKGMTALFYDMQYGKYTVKNRYYGQGSKNKFQNHHRKIKHINQDITDKMA